MRRTYVYRDGKMVEKKTTRRSSAAPEAIVRSDVRFESRQLPKFWQNHTGTFSSDGKPQCNSRYEATEAAKRMSGEEDVNCEYDAL